MGSLGLDVQQLFEDYGKTSNGGNVIQMDMAREMRTMVRRSTPVDVWEPYSLADVMRESLLLEPERMAVAGSQYPLIINLEFEQAYSMYHVVADGPLYAYLEEWFQERGVWDWHETKHVAMRVMWTYWSRRRKYQDA